MRERYGATAGVPPSHPVRVDVPDCNPFKTRLHPRTHTEALISHFHNLLMDLMDVVTVQLSFMTHNPIQAGELCNFSESVTSKCTVLRDTYIFVCLCIYIKIYGFIINAFPLIINYDHTSF